MRVLLIDHHDSYTHNLAHLIARVTGEWPTIRACDALSIDDAIASDPRAVVLSPGPGRPDVARDVGVSAEIVRRFSKTPILGVCLGHQIIAHVHGAKVGRARRPLHGRTSPIAHTKSRVLAGLPQGFSAMRYHSLSVHAPLPAPLLATAHSDDGELMALEHATRPLFGVQFHPESIATEIGETLLGRFFSLAGVEKVAAPPRTTTRPRPAGNERVEACAVSAWHDPERVFQALFADEPDAFFLHSNDRDPARRRFSVMGTGERSATSLDAVVTRPARAEAIAHLPFVGGLVGWRSYEGEDVFLAADETLVFDHQRRTIFACAPDRERARRLAERCTESDEPAGSGKSKGSFHCDRVAYEALVRRCIELIKDGEAYELCLTNRFTGTTTIAPFALYRRLARESPSNYAAFLRAGGRAVVSSSPERLLTVQDGVAESRPIKGTRPRGTDASSDAAAAAALSASDKDRAENLMIVDVARHDLGSVSVLSGVSVPRLLEVEAHPTLFQLVSTVRAELRDDASPSAVLAAMFPPASMTGAPKQRAIEHLRTLEGSPRGVYSGALGYVDRSGAMDFQVVIRTVVLDSDAFSFGVGGAVLLDSDPTAEWEETLVKARAMVRALGLDAPDRR
jgi:para-aminobenzoate synthetase